ncbi:hypothetical protein BURPS668_1605 [Burkholderia pseudomallei 668]|nr:hypothetical protein BURPS668_1605 [Burkholderia pseudomallei 668]
MIGEFKILDPHSSIWGERGMKACIRQSARRFGGAAASVEKQSHCAE